MRVLTRYVLADFAVTFGLTLLVFTFVMYVVALMHAINMLAQGVSVVTILKIIWFNVPFLMSSTLPMSALTTSLLVFGRLSVDGEITALKACGLSLWQITSPILLFAVLLSSFCLYLNFYTAPNSHFARRQAKMNLTDFNPLALLEEGRFNYDFPGIQIYAGQIRQEGNGGFARIKDVIMYEIDSKGLRRNVRAKSGTIEVDEQAYRMNIELRNVVIENHDPDNPEKVSILPAEIYNFTPGYEHIIGGKNVTKSHKDFNLVELLKAIRDPREVFPKAVGRLLAREKMKAMLEFHSRVANAIACFSFILLGIPLGLRNRRHDSSFGISVSLGIMLLFYAFMAIGESLEAHPRAFPDLIMWVPIISCQVLGFFLFRKAA